VSRLYFHTEHDATAELMGAEAHWLHAIPNAIALGFVPHEHRTLEPFLARGSFLRPLLNTPALAANLSAALTVDDGHLVDDAGHPLESFQLILNTALVVGSDAVALAARLAGQCEIHCYVEGSNREWMASLIDQGHTTGLYRSGMGWEQVADLLRVRADQPVVCSYSVTDSFPNPTVAGWQPNGVDEYGERDWDAWYDLADSEQWSMSLAGLRRDPDRGLELAPERLRYPFGHERSFIDLFVRSPVTARALTSS
jgi:hypothetical protein